MILGSLVSLSLSFCEDKQSGFQRQTLSGVCPSLLLFLFQLVHSLSLGVSLFYTWIIWRHLE